MHENKAKRPVLPEADRVLPVLRNSLASIDRDPGGDFAACVALDKYISDRGVSGRGANSLAVEVLP